MDAQARRDTAASQMLSEVPPQDAGVAERRAKVEAWDQAVTELAPKLAAQAAGRVALQAEFDALNQRPDLPSATDGLLALQQRTIDQRFPAAGVYAGERVYNDSGDRNYHRTQSAYDTIDPRGNVVRTYQSEKREAGLNGKPVASVPYIQHANPRHEIITRP